MVYEFWFTASAEGLPAKAGKILNTLPTLHSSTTKPYSQPLATPELSKLHELNVGAVGLSIKQGALTNHLPGFLKRT